MISEFKGKYQFLSNFYPAPVRLDGLFYRSVEHAYQAAKTNSPKEREDIRKTIKPGDAKRLGRKVTLRDDWEVVKLSVMMQLLQDKFSALPYSVGLIATGDEELVEGNNWGDTFWGVCAGQGENHLGKMLMQIRKELQL